MDQLFPIIRRVRRPLVVADAPPVVVGSVEPVQPVATLSLVKPVATDKPLKQPDANSSANRDGR